MAPACPRLVKKLSLRAHRAIQSARLQRSETPVSTAMPEKVLVRSVLLAGARTLGSGRWVKGLHEATARRAALEYARHGRSIGGESPLEEEVVLTPSRRQLRRREAGWEGSPRRIPAPRNTNRVEGGAIWVSLLKKAKPVTINRVVT